MKDGVDVKEEFEWTEEKIMQYAEQFKVPYEEMKEQVDKGWKPLFIIKQE